MFNNNPEWFSENKKVYQQYVQAPMNELASDIFRQMTEKYEPLLISRVSRIYKDARYARGEGKYRDRLWFSLGRQSEHTGTPAFFFEITPEGYAYGMGYYYAPPRTMAAFRKHVDAHEREFISIISELNRRGLFTLYGDKYKKKKGDKPEPVADWYERKSIGLIAEHPIGRELFSAEIAGIIMDGFVSLLPLYRFLWSFEQESL
jgi:uncharacterized protein (TIGR02453 family)